MTIAEFKDDFGFYLPAIGSFLIAIASALVFYLVYRFIKRKK